MNHYAFVPSNLHPVVKSEEEIKQVLVEAMSGILGCGVTKKALQLPGSMTIEDIELNLHLYERLGTAMAALGALRGYRDLPRGFIIKERV